MSHWIREEGTIKLPTAEFARVRQALQDADTEVKMRALGVAQQFWEDTPAKVRSDPQAYRVAYRAFEERMRHLPESVSDKVEELTNTYYAAKPSRPLKKDLQLPTNKTLDFTAGYGTAISFDRKTSTLSWYSDVSSNQPSPRESSLGQAMYKALDSVKWTRGTGGHIRGWDEYGADAGHGSSPQEGFGPLGEEEAPFACRAYHTSTGGYRSSQAIVQSQVSSMRSSSSGTNRAQGRRKSGEFDFKANHERSGRL